MTPPVLKECFFYENTTVLLCAEYRGKQDAFLGQETKALTHWIYTQ